MSLIPVLHGTINDSNSYSEEPTVVTQRFDEYDQAKWQSLLQNAMKNFGPKGKRWSYTIHVTGGNEWVVDFEFMNSSDALMFMLTAKN